MYSRIFKLFLMSYAEALQYFDVQLEEAAGAADNMKSRVALTGFAFKNGAWTYSNDKTADGIRTGRYIGGCQRRIQHIKANISNLMRNTAASIMSVSTKADRKISALLKPQAR